MQTKCFECNKDLTLNDYFYEFEGERYCEECIDEKRKCRGYSDEPVYCSECGQEILGDCCYYEIDGVVYCDVCLEEGHRKDTDDLDRG